MSTFEKFVKKHPVFTSFCLFISMTAMWIRSIPIFITHQEGLFWKFLGEVMIACMINLSLIAAYLGYKAFRKNRAKKNAPPPSQ